MLAYSLFLLDCDWIVALGFLFYLKTAMNSAIAVVAKADPSLEG